MILQTRTKLGAALSSWVLARIVIARSLVSVALGAAAGATLTYIQTGLAEKSFSFSRLDWHAVGINAAGAAMLSILAHFANAPTTNLPIKKPDANLNAG